MIDIHISPGLSCFNFAVAVTFTSYPAIMGDFVAMLVFDFHLALHFVRRGDLISAERLIYHVLLTLKTSFDKPWELVCDLTQTSRMNQVNVSKLGVSSCKDVDISHF